MKDFVSRAATEQLREAIADFRVVIVNGPRQAGKTTLLEGFHAAGGGTYRSFDDPEDLQGAIADPVSFVRQGERPLILDEVQRAGNELVLAIKRLVDSEPAPGQFVLSGSTRFLTVPNLSESLAGRAVFVDLWPFCMVERTNGAHHFIQTIFSEPNSLIGASSPWERGQYLELMCGGSYPEVVRTNSASSRQRWFNGYLRTVLARDISNFTQVDHASVFNRLLGLLAARVGGTLVLSDVGKALGVSHETVSRYISYLETVFLVVRVPAWSTNLTSRLVKTPKAFLTDTGITAYLTRTSPQALANPGHPVLGGLTENFVFTELLKLRSLTMDAFELYHYRDRDGREIDFICEAPDGRILAIEVKASASPSATNARHLAWLRDKVGDRFVAGIVLHMGERSFSYGERIIAAPLSTLWDHGQ